jgi:AbrB family looped-hinge helix DNA binding protein
MRAENITRRVDNLGRVVLPKNLRLRAGIADGDELEIFTLEESGRYYICLSKADFEDPRYAVARGLLEELGLEIPEELLES